MKNLEKNAYSVLECSKKRWKIVEKILEKCWKKVEKILKNHEKSWKKCWKSFENMLECHIIPCQLHKTAQQDK